MEIDPTFIWQTSLWLLPLIILGFAGLALLNVRWWQTRSFQELKGLRAALRELHAQRKDILLALRGRSRDEPEPFGSRLNALFTALNQLHSQVATVEARLVGVQRQIHYLRSRRWEVIIGAPYFWYLLHKDLTHIQHELQHTQAALRATQELKAQVDGVVQEVARQVHEEMQALASFQQRLNTLQARNLSGDGVQALNAQMQQIHLSFAQVPAEVLEAKEELPQEIDQRQIASIYNLLVDNQPLIEGIDQQLRHWEEQLERIHKNDAEARRMLGELRALIATLPEQINVETIRAELSHLQLRSDNLGEALKQMSDEALERWLFEAEALVQKLPSLQTRLQAGLKAQSQLEAEFQSLQEDLKRLSFLFTDLNTHAVYPIAWEESMSRFTQVNREVKSLGEAQQRRTLEEVHQTLEAARRLHSRVDQLAAHLRTVQEMHAQLLALNSIPNARDLQQWLKSSAEVAHMAQEYAIDNWPRQLAAHDLAGELDAFQARYAPILEAGKSHPIAERQLPQRLAQMRAFRQDYDHLAQLVEAVETELQHIRAQESSALESLSTTQAILGQLDFLVQSNAFLSEIAGKHLEQYHVEAAKMKQQLDDKRHGAMEKKAARMVALSGRIEAQANQWLRKITQDTWEKSRQIQQTCETLEHIGRLEEQTLVHAAQVLKEVEASDLRMPRLGMEELLPQLKRQCDLWQKCRAAQQALEDLARPLLQAYEEVQKQRQETLQAFKAFSKELEQPQAWPPTSITLASEQEQLQQIEAQWENLGQKPQRAIHLVAALGNLSARYQTLLEHLRQNQERATRERAQVAELTDELEELAMQWQQQWHLNRDQPQVRRQIDQLLDELDAELNQLKRRYWRGELRYPHVIATLKSLQNTMRNQEVEVDEEYTLDILGRIRRRR